jgi:hypothetical protein
MELKFEATLKTEKEYVDTLNKLQQIVTFKEDKLEIGLGLLSFTELFKLLNEIYECEYGWNIYASDNEDGTMLIGAELEGQKWSETDWCELTVKPRISDEEVMEMLEIFHKIGDVQAKNYIMKYDSLLYKAMSSIVKLCQHQIYDLEKLEDANELLFDEEEFIQLPDLTLPNPRQYSLEYD